MIKGNEGKGVARAWYERSSWVLFPTVLTLVASIQVLLATFGTLSPWKGGGFGMFATLDPPANRVVSVTARDSNGNIYRVVIPGGGVPGVPELSPTFRSKLMAYPSHARKRRVARAVVKTNLVLSTRDLFDVPTRLAHSPVYGWPLSTSVPTVRALEAIGSERDADSFSDIEAIVVRVYRLMFDPQTTTAHLEELGQPAIVGPAQDAGRDGATRQSDSSQGGSW